VTLSLSCTVPRDTEILTLLLSGLTAISRWIWVSRCQNVSILILLELRMMEVLVITGAIIRAKLQSNHHRQQINTKLSTRRIPFMSLSQQCQSTERNENCKFVPPFWLHYLFNSIISASGSRSGSLPLEYVTAFSFKKLESRNYQAETKFNDNL